MKLTVRAVASVVLGLLGVALLGVAVSQLLDIGTCASGGPYVTTRECPKGTGVWAVLAPVGVVVWMAGLVLSKEGLVTPGTGQIVWTAGFAGLGIAMLVKALTQPALGPDARLAAYILAAVFIPMGLAVGIGGLLQLRHQRRRARTRPRTPRGPVPPGSEARWKQLSKLRSTGALTRAEFEQLRDDATSLDTIQRLADLRASGVLTAEEFEAKKRSLIRSG